MKIVDWTELSQNETAVPTKMTETQDRSHCYSKTYANSFGCLVKCYEKLTQKLFV